MPLAILVKVVRQNKIILEIQALINTKPQFGSETTIFTIVTICRVWSFGTAVFTT